ncbi:GntR family transcriptional regulator [Microbacterium betulae]|uniref:GntR family transcriptional regulator n=1 Tax=Microbacterium betulae TaxID=2981139 RepID=A0AA97FIJ3_9MICO|nr:GntR family transcriptional regulator [Microbacterium sp. AB]WOF23254.1 GntR family transcriptional regulator [Microbacterium sp. AB]
MTSGTKRTKAQQAHDIIRQQIIRCELRPGELLSEARLVEVTGLGHTPIRDALQWLSNEGLVTITARRGTAVAPLNLDDVQQIFDLRIAIESVIADQALRHITDEHLDALRELIRILEDGAGPELESDPDIDRRFHETLLDATGNRYLVSIYSGLHDASLRLFYLTRCGMEPRSQQLDSLRATLAACTEHDGAALREVLVEHVKDFRKRVTGAI